MKALERTDDDMAARSAIATGEFFARTTAKEFRSHLIVETLRPLDLLAEGLTPFPGTMPAIRALKAPHMQPQHDRTLQDGQVA